MVLVADRGAAFADNDFGLVFLGIVGVVVRLAIATESVRCSESGVRWRSLFASYEIPWGDIANIDVGARDMRLLVISGRFSSVAPCICIERTQDQAPLWITPSVWTSLTRQGEFIAAARLISPADWSLTDGTTGTRTSGTPHNPSGKRVGRPTRRSMTN